MVARSLCRAVRQVARFTAATYALPSHVRFNGLARRYLNTVTSSPAAVLLPSDQKRPSLGPKLRAVDWADSRDALVRVETDTGKTLAHIIPAVESRLEYLRQHAGLAVVGAGLENSFQDTGRTRLTDRVRSAGPLILAHTRELAIGIARDVQKFTTHRGGFEVQLLVGGSDKARQKQDWMESSRDLVVATPGRLRDLLTNEPEFRQAFKDCPMLILDETDMLLSMGFRDDIDAIVSFLPRPPLRQTLLFSATVSRAVRQLASWILSPNHRFINATPSEPGLAASRNDGHSAHPELAVPCDDGLTTRHPVEQFYTLCPTASKQLPTLLKLLAHDQLMYGSRSKVIIFCPTDQMAELIATVLGSLVEDVLPGNTTEIVKLHFKMKQSDRNQTRVLLRTGRARGAQDGRPTVLVSSDVSARGVDYPGVTRVIQVGIPSTETLHIRRMERMARAVNSFAPRTEAEDDDRPILRADLLLLPWEAGYLDWHLTSLPINPFPIPVLDSQLASLSARSPTLTTEFLNGSLVEVQRRVDPTNVRGTAASLLGYYLPLTPSLRLEPRAVLAGVSSWTSECFHVPIPAITRFPRKFAEAYKQSIQSRKTKGLFADRLRLARPSLLGKAKSRNRSVWEGAHTQKRKPKRWH